jgi:hypothetical protein
MIVATTIIDYHYDAKLLDAYTGTTQTIIWAIILSFLAIYVFFLAIFFHIEYFIKNRKEEYEIGNGQIIKYKNGTEKIYDCTDIKHVVLYLTHTKYDFRIYGCSHDNYHFVKIVMKSGEIIYLTSLLYPSGVEKILKEYMPEVPYYRETRWFPTTLY